MDFYKWIDDFFVDGVCQPICDWLRRMRSLTKRVPTAVSVILAAVCILPFAYSLLFSGKTGGALVSSLLMLVSIAFLIQAGKLLLQEACSSDSPSCYGEVDCIERVHDLPKRASLLLITVFAVPFIVDSAFSGAASEQFVFGAMLIGLVANLFSIWFKACVDRPMPIKFKESEVSK